MGEAVTAALYVGIVLLDGADWVLIPHLVFVSALVLVSQVDLEVRLIPDAVILPVAALGVPLMILFGGGPWWGMVSSADSAPPACCSSSARSTACGAWRAWGSGT